MHDVPRTELGVLNILPQVTSPSISFGKICERLKGGGAGRNNEKMTLGCSLECNLPAYLILWGLCISLSLSYLQCVNPRKLIVMQVNLALEMQMNVSGGDATD